MNIFENLIKDTEIIGIGDLNGTEANHGCAGTELQYSFRVFTKASSIMIYSPSFTTGQVNNADAWLKKYLQVREKIAEQIGEVKAEQ